MEKISNDEDIEALSETSSVNSSRVFFIFDSALPTEDSIRFGERVFLWEKAPNPLASNGIEEEIEQKLSENEFDPDKDILALTGPTAFLAVFIAVVVNITEGPIQFLIFNPKNSKYAKRTLLK